MLAGVNEGLLPFATDDDPVTPERLAEERRLMYVGITRARRTLAVSWLRRRKKGREMVAGLASRFVAEMKLEEGGRRAMHALNSRPCGCDWRRKLRRRMAKADQRSLWSKRSDIHWRSRRSSSP